MGRRLKIYLFRHGRTDYNVEGKFTGWKDSHLVLRGKLDAMKVARKLRNKKFQVAIHTRLSRSKETLDYVLKYHPECKKILVDDRMIERSYGVMEGKDHKSFIESLGEQEYSLRIHGDALTEVEDKRLIKKIKKFLGEEEYKAIHRGYKVKLPKGESFYDVEVRVRSFIKWLKKYMVKNNVSVAISAHGNSIRLFRKIMEKVSIEKMSSWNIPYDEFYEYSI